MLNTDKYIVLMDVCTWRCLCVWQCMCACRRSMLTATVTWRIASRVATRMTMRLSSAAKTVSSRCPVLLTTARRWTTGACTVHLSSDLECNCNITYARCRHLMCTSVFSCCGGIAHFLPPSIDGITLLSQSVVSRLDVQAISMAQSKTW